MPSRPTVIDLFAGVGGLSLGFEQAGFDVVAAVEADPVHAATYSFNHPTTRLSCADVASLDAEQILEDLDGADVLAGGLPSSGFSIGGLRDSNDERNGALHEFARLVETIRPAHFVLETVPGICQGAASASLHRILLRLADEGYPYPQVWKLQSAEFGVPQSRLRIFVIGSREGALAPRVPSPAVWPVYKRPAGLPIVPRHGLSVGPTVWDAIGDLPDLARLSELASSDTALLNDELTAECVAASSEYARMLRGLAQDPFDFSAGPSVDQALLTASQATEHSLRAAWRFGRTPPGSSEPVSRYYRLHPQGLSSTLRAGSGQERGSFTSPRPLHPLHPRVITVREGARLQSFPDWYGFNATKWHGFRQVGASAPPLLARAVANSVLAALEIVPEPAQGPRNLGDRALLKMDSRSAAAHLGVPVPPVTRLRGHGRRERKRRALNAPARTAPLWV